MYKITKLNTFLEDNDVFAQDWNENFSVIAKAVDSLSVQMVIDDGDYLNNDETDPVVLAPTKANANPPLITIPIGLTSYQLRNWTQYKQTITASSQNNYIYVLPDVADGAKIAIYRDQVAQVRSFSFSQAVIYDCPAWLLQQNYKYHIVLTKVNGQWYANVAVFGYQSGA